jgi:ribosomal protein S18 acetylase RimI-like enzyme
VQQQSPFTVLSRPDGISITRVGSDDPVLGQVSDLSYETLHRPFGVTRQVTWNDSDPASTHFVATDGTVLAGYARLVATPDGGHVRQVVVAPGYRARGVAADLVTLALARARELKLETAFLHARLRAVGVYERVGFRVVSSPFRMGRTYLPHVRMELRLK